MCKKTVYSLTFLIVLATGLYAQTPLPADSSSRDTSESAEASLPVPQKYTVSLFTPLFLDSVFNDTVYKQGKDFPKFINPGIEFYHGAQLAIDSLNKEGVPLDVYIYDTRSSSSRISSVVQSEAFRRSDLIIGHVSAGEVRPLASAAAQLEIPFINVNYPNDAGVSDNPHFVLLNSTLHTHCAAIYKFIQTKYALAPVIVFRKKGKQEDRLKEYFEEIERSTSAVSLKIKYVTLDNNFTAATLREHLRKEQPTVCIAGSLDLNFGQALTEQLAQLYTTHPSVVFGMPNWWETLEFGKPEYKDVEVFYTTPFYVSATDSLAESVRNFYNAKFYAPAPEMLFKGYEVVYHFVHLLQLFGKNMGSSLSNKQFRLFSDFDIRPVINPKTNTLDYFENKKIYFVKKVNGEIKIVH